MEEEQFFKYLLCVRKYFKCALNLIFDNISTVGVELIANMQQLYNKYLDE